MKTNYTHAVVLDFEATCDDVAPPRPQEVIEFPSVLLSTGSMEIVDEFTAFVRPYHHPKLPDFCTELTSIRQTDIDGAASFGDVLCRHQAWLEGHGLNVDNAIVVTCGDWDLKTMFPAQCRVAVPTIETISQMYRRWHNLKRSFCKVHNCDKAPGMAGMLRAAGLPLVGHHHRGIDDCRNLAALLRTLVEGGAVLGVTGELTPEAYPPITVRLRMDQTVKTVRLDGRRVKSLLGLAHQTFKRRARVVRRSDGTAIETDLALVSLMPQEEILIEA